MKKYLFKLLFVVLALSLALFAVSCTTSSTSESLLESEESVVESKPEESVVEIPIVGAGENGEINLGDSLDLLSPILNNEYITVNFTMDATSTTNAIKVANKTHLSASIKKIVNGYNVIASISNVVETQGQTVPVMDMDIYYVDGLVVYGVSYYQAENPETEWYKFEAGSFNELVNALNEMIASDEAATEAYKEIMKAVDKLKIILNEEDLANNNRSLSFDLANAVNSALAFVIEHEEDAMYDFLLENVAGIDPADEKAVAEFEEYVVGLCSSNPTLAVVLDEAVELLNATLMDIAKAEANGEAFDESQVAQLDIESLLDTIQQYLGITTAEVVELVKAEFPSFSDYLTAPEEGESLYDYLYTRLQMVTINDLAKFIKNDNTATAVSVLGEFKSYLQNVTLGALINGFLNDYLTSPSEADKDYLAIVKESNLSLQAFVVGFTFKTDSYGRPTELGNTTRIQASYLCLEAEGQTRIITAETEDSMKLNLSYGKIYISFEIPQEALDSAVEVELN